MKQVGVAQTGSDSYLDANGVHSNMTAIYPIEMFRREAPMPTKPPTRPLFKPTDFTPALKTELLILQPTPFCNINCDYCYLPNRDSKALMSIDTVRYAAKRLLDDGLVGPALTIVWHAGEPLTAPIEFFDEAIAIVGEVFGPDRDVTHSIQTNATLIDDSWCKLFARHRMRIGVSVDGPKHLHDSHRKTRSGKGTHAKAMQGMACLRKHGIPFHAIAVVTRNTLCQPSAFLDFFAEQGVSQLGCNFDEAEGVYERSSLEGNEAVHETFWRVVLERYSLSGSELPSVRELEMILNLISHPLPTYEWQKNVWPANAQTLPFALVSVSHNGDFCTFSPEFLGQSSREYDDFVLGNVQEKGYFAAASSPVFDRLWRGILQGTLECERSCAHFGFCGGGAPVNKLYENKSLSSGETLYCRTMLKRPFDMTLEWLEKGNRAGLQRKSSGGEVDVAC